MAEKKTIFVKIGRMGERIKEMAFISGITLNEALDKTGVKYDGHYEQLIYNGTAGQPVPIYVSDKDVILIQKRVIPKMINIRVARVGEPIQHITVAEGSSVHRCLIAAGRGLFDGEEIWVHKDDKGIGTKAGLEFPAYDGDYIILEMKILNMRDKIYAIIRNICEDENGEWDKATDQICTMLEKDFQISPKRY
jgi:hypothetical protein